MCRPYGDFRRVGAGTVVPYGDAVGRVTEPARTDAPVLSSPWPEGRRTPSSADPMRGQASRE